MTDIDFRRFASLLFSLKLVGITETPISDGLKFANQLLKELQKYEQQN